MQKLFEKNTAAQVAIILASVVLLWAGPLMRPAPMAPAAGYAPLYQLLFDLHMPPLVAVVAALLLTLAGGFGLNVVLSEAGLVPQRSLLPTLLFLALASTGTQTLTPTLFAMLLTVLLARLLMVRTSLLSLPAGRICSAGAVIAVSSMFYLPSLTLLVTYLLVAVNYRLYGWRDWMLLLLGLLAPYLLLWIVRLLSGGLLASLSATADGLADVGIVLGAPTPLAAVACAALLVVFVASLFSFRRQLGENPVVWQKNAAVWTLTTLPAVAMLFYSQLFPVDTRLLATPFALSGSLMLLSTSPYRPRGKRDWRPWTHTATLLLTLACAALC